MASAARYFWLDGELRNSSDSSVPFISAGLQYGVSVFEGIRSDATEREPAIFRLEEHADRLLDSAHIIGFRELPFTKSSLIDAMHHTVAANGLPACYIRPLVLLD